MLCYDVQFREANEEVELPLRSPHVHTLCTLEPFVSQYRVMVTPVIAFLDDVGVLDGLRAAPGEVARIFDHPLEAVLDSELMCEEETPLVLGSEAYSSENWPYETELQVRSPTPRVYFCSFGLTLCVCLAVKCRNSRTPHGWAVFIACTVSGAPPRL